MTTFFNLLLILMSKIQISQQNIFNYAKMVNFRKCELHEILSVASHFVFYFSLLYFIIYTNKYLFGTQNDILELKEYKVKLMV